MSKMENRKSKVKKAKKVKKPKNIKVNSAFITLIVKGGNANILIETLKREGVELLDIIFLNKNKVKFTVRALMREKVFAITNKMCYNIVSVREKGFLRAISFTLKNFGLFIGILLFLFLSSNFSNICLGIDFYGESVVYQSRLTQYLEDKGIKKFSYLSDTALKKVEKECLIDNDYLTFVSLKRRGTRLKVTAYLSDGKDDKENKKADKLISSVSGKVVFIKALRGNATVSVGDLIEKGQTLIDGRYIDIFGEEKTVLIIGSCVIETKKEFSYYSKNDNEEDIAVAITLGEVTFDMSYTVSKIKEKDGFCYKVTVFSLVTVTAN